MKIGICRTDGRQTTSIAKVDMQTISKQKCSSIWGFKCKFRFRKRLLAKSYFASANADYSTYLLSNNQNVAPNVLFLLLRISNLLYKLYIVQTATLVIPSTFSPRFQNLAGCSGECLNSFEVKNKSLQHTHAPRISHSCSSFCSAIFSHSSRL